MTRGSKIWKLRPRRLVGKIQRTGEYCSNMFLDNEDISRYYFFGETDNSQGFISFVDEMMPERAALFFTPFQDKMAAAGVTVPSGAQDRNGLIPRPGHCPCQITVSPLTSFIHTKRKPLRPKPEK